LRFEPLPEDDPKRRKPVIEIALRSLGWRPTVTLKDGLKATIAYFLLHNTAPELAMAPRRGPPRRPSGRGRLSLASQR
jgi:UDP-glucuronate decarboxylase